MKNLDIKNFNYVYFIGIGGISMSALAKYFLEQGKTVLGSDERPSQITSALIKLGVKVFFKHDKENLSKLDIAQTLVVYTSAILDDNPELVYAKIAGFKVVKRSQVLGRILKEYKFSFTVSGSHGKTTATTMLTTVLKNAGKNPTAFLGGESLAFSNYLSGSKNVCVAEACEFRKNFLDLSPTFSIVLNLDMDHHDSFDSFRDYVETFKKFTQNSTSFINADDKNSTELIGVKSITFGIKKSAHYIAKNIKKVSDGYTFTVYAFSRRLGKFYLPVKGRFNVYNALSVIAVCDTFGLSFDDIYSGLKSYSGVKRRAEKIGEIKGKPVICDYAHHPKEIASTLRALKSKNSLVIFQPHTYSRTKVLMKDFVKALKNIENLIIYKTYPAREKLDEEGTAFALYHNLKGSNKNRVVYADSEVELVFKIKAFYNFSDVIVLGAGDVYETALKTVKIGIFKN